MGRRWACESRSGFPIHPRVPPPHLLGLTARAFNLDQLAFSDSRTPRGRLLPLALGIHQLRPKREDPALGGLGGMDGAAFFAKEMALAVARHAQPEQVPGAIHVAALKV